MDAIQPTVVDSSVWIDHFARSIPLMDALLTQRRLLAHPFAKGEVLVGSVRDRARVRLFLDSVEQIAVVDNDGVLQQLEAWQAYNPGTGWIDMHLLSATHAAAALLWTRDRRLGSLAADLGLRFTEA